MFSHSIKLESDITTEPVKEISDHDIDDVTTIVHFVNIHDVDDPKPSVLKPNGALARHYKQPFALLFSVILHALAFYLLMSLDVRIPDFKKDMDEPIIVQAKLYTPRPSELIDPKETATSEPKPTSVSVIEKPDVSEDENISVDAEEPIDVAPESSIRVSSVLEEPVKESNVLTLGTQQEALAPVKSVFDGRASRHVRALEQAKQSRMANQAAKDFQYNKTHPEIKAIPSHALTVTEQQQKAIKIEFDCKTAASKALGTALRYISGFGHGTKIGQGPIRCYKNGGIEPFIKKRVEKPISSLPSQ